MRKGTGYVAVADLPSSENEEEDLSTHTGKKHITLSGEALAKGKQQESTNNTKASDKIYTSLIQGVP